MGEYVLVADIHGNYPSLQAVVDKEGKNAQYVILGDIMGLLGYPQETVELVQSLDTAAVLAGNHDKAIFHHEEGHVGSDELSLFEYQHTMDSLTLDQIEWMESLPYMDVLTDSGSRICCTHSMPWPEQASGYEVGNAGVTKRDLPQVAAVVGSDYDWVFHGHTHHQYEQDCAKFGHHVQFVNPGSVCFAGEYAVVDTDAGTVELKQVAFDSTEVTSHVQAALHDAAPAAKNWFDPNV
jgi:predicted phosphodiesterase